MQIISRLLIAVLAMLLLSLGGSLLFDTSAAMAKVGLTTSAEMGLGTLRADVAGFFLVAGMLCIWGAATLNRNVLWPVQLLMVFALLGRLVTLLVDGAGAAGIPQMGVELAVIGLLQWARTSWPSSPTI